MSADGFWSRVEKTGSCWLWKSTVGRNGYGYFRTTKRNRLAHRVAYELVVGPIPDGLHLDHLCRVRHCVNPSHLEPVTPGENIRRGEPANRTHCPREHEYTPENTRVRGGKRHCLACHRIHQANYLARKAAS